MNGADTGACIIQYGTAAERAALVTAEIKPLTEWYETDTGAYWKWFGSWFPWDTLARIASTQIIAPKPSGDLSGIKDDANINATLNYAASTKRPVFIQAGLYITAGGIRQPSNVQVFFSAAGVEIKMRDRVTASVTNITGNTLTLSTVAGVSVGMHVSDASVTPTTFQASGNAFGGIPYATVVGVINSTLKTVTLVAEIGGAAVNPTTTLDSGINLHPRANVWSQINASNISLSCPDGWFTLNGNWTEMYPYNAFSDDANRNCLRTFTGSDITVDGLISKDAFYHGWIGVGRLSGIRIGRYRSNNNGYRSIHFHSEAIAGDTQPEVRDNYAQRLELIGDGHRAFYTRSNDENNSGLFLMFQNCINTVVGSVLAKDQYGFSFVGSGGAVAGWAGKYAKFVSVGSLVQENCGEGVQFASNFSGAEMPSIIGWSKEITVPSCVFTATASVLRYYVDAVGTIKTVVTRLIDIPNQSGVGAVAALSLRPGYRCYASGGSTGANTIAGMVIWECLIGTGAGGVDQVRVFRDDDNTAQPYTTAATVSMTIHGTKGADFALFAGSGDTVNNIKVGEFLSVGAAKGITMQAANGVYRYNDISFGSITIKRGYRLGYELSSIKNLNIGKVHTEDCASGFPGGGGGSTYDNYMQNCTGNVSALSSTVNAGFSSSSKTLRIDNETRAMTITPMSIQKSSSSQLMIESLVTAGAGANSAGVSGPVVLVNPCASDGTPLTVAAGNITRTDAAATIITRPVDAA